MTGTIAPTAPSFAEAVTQMPRRLRPRDIVVIVVTGLIAAGFNAMAQAGAISGAMPTITIFLVLTAVTILAESLITLSMTQSPWSLGRALWVTSGSLLLMAPLLGATLLFWQAIARPSQSLQYVVPGFGLLWAGLALKALLAAWPVAMAKLSRPVDPRRILQATRGRWVALLVAALVVKGISDLSPDLSGRDPVQVGVVGLVAFCVGAVVIVAQSAIAAAAWEFARQADVSLDEPSR